MQFSFVLTVFGLLGAGVSQAIPSTTSLATSALPTSRPVPRSSRSSSRRSSRTSSLILTTPPAPAPSSSSSVVVPANSTVTSVITTAVNVFVTICATPTTFTINGNCYTATSANQPITVTNCGCTVVAPPPTGGVTAIPTGAIATSAAGAIGATATQYAAATATKYVTAGAANINVMMSLMAFFMTLPLFAALML